MIADGVGRAPFGGLKQLGRFEDRCYCGIVTGDQRTDICVVNFHRLSIIQVPNGFAGEFVQIDLNNAHGIVLGLGLIVVLDFLCLDFGSWCCIALLLLLFEGFDEPIL